MTDGVLPLEVVANRIEVEFRVEQVTLLFCCLVPELIELLLYIKNSIQAFARNFLAFLLQ